MRRNLTGKCRPAPRKALLAAAVVLLLTLLVSAAWAGDWMSEARAMLPMINALRTGDNAWYWNADNETVTVETGLKALAYDLELEEIAKVRAAELAVSFSHTRPDGSKWSTAFPAGNYYKAENIAAGFESAEDMFNGFLEENEDYAGQGHRRNMLKKTLTRVGMAAVEIGGTVYWVQEFASGSVKSKPDDTPKVTAGWVQDGGVYYYGKEDGSRATGWLQDGGSWYYLDATGAMQTGWQSLGGEWYYFTAGGAMRTGWMSIGEDWYCFDDNGAMRTGWAEIEKKWYYFDEGGVMQTDWQQIRGKWYYLGEDGVMRQGWQQIDGSWYYFSTKGVMQLGWQQIHDRWYYFRSSGAMATGRVTIDGQTEIFTADGVWQYSEIQDYDTPLGTDPWIQVIRQFVRTLLSFFEG